MTSTTARPSIRDYPVLPLRELVVFPSMVVPLFVGRERSLRSVAAAQEGNREILVVTQRNASSDDPAPEDLHGVGTVVQILQVFNMPDGVVKVLVEGSRRARIVGFTGNQGYLEVTAVDMPDDDEQDPAVQALMRNVIALFEQYVKVSRKVPSEVLVVASSVESSGRLADIISANLNLKLEEKQEILAATSSYDRLVKLTELIQREIEIQNVEKRISDRVRKQMEQLQKEYYMREQLKAIQRELGETDEIKAEIEQFKERVARASMPEDAEERALQELDRLAKMGYNSAESAVIRNYLDVLCDLPWSKASPDNVDVRKAARILEEDHHGLQEPKERILEFLAVLKLRKTLKGPILCFMGPPGVGKTSLARSIARAMGREFVRMSLGGVKDEAEIRGHRRTYVGAMPGRIIQLIRRAGTRNPVFLLDEIDKTGSDWRGDISSALLEVLDPEQNITFQDHYVGLAFDLSQVLFITTANIPHTIPGPLRDRMEILHLPGYTEEEKVAIARRYLVPKQCAENGLRKRQFEIGENAIQAIIRRYTSEAGIRDLERHISKIMRKVARDIVDRRADRTTVRITVPRLAHFLGIPKYREDQAEQVAEIGVSMGLSWTSGGGQTMPIEAVVMPGTGSIIMTGHLGPVMQESVKAAITHVRSHPVEFGLGATFHKRFDVHVHAPQGGIPKDGPASGITIATAVVSAITRRPVRHDLAMTGELTLQGRVLPVEGLKEKALAAFRTGLKEVIVPQENQKDLEEIPADIRDHLKFTRVTHLSQVLDAALVRPRTRRIPRSRTV